jgi:hypothetical protein
MVVIAIVKVAVLILMKGPLAQLEINPMESKTRTK